MFNKGKKQDNTNIVVVQNENKIKDKKRVSEKNKPPFYKRPIFYLIITVILLVIFFITAITMRLCMFFGVGDNAVKNTPILYIQENQLMYKNQLMDDPGIADTSLNWNDGFSNLSNSTRINKKGDYILYLDNVSNSGGDLFLKYVYKDKKRKGETESEGRKISSNVKTNGFLFTNKGYNFVFVQEDGTLNLYEKNKVYAIDTNVIELIGLDEEGLLYYLKHQEATDKYILYSFDTNSKKSKPNEIDKNIVTFYSFNDGNLIYIQNESSATNSNNVKLYSNGKISILCEKSEAIEDVSSEGQIFFTRRNKTVTEFLEFFADKNFDEDLDLAEPREEEFTSQKKNIFGTVKTVVDSKAYNEAKEKYQDKIRRDEIRNELSQEYSINETLTFLFKTGTSETVIADNIENIISADAENASAMYDTYTFIQNKKMDIDDFKNAKEAKQAIEKALLDQNNYSRITYFTKIGFKPIVVSESALISDSYFDDDNYLYYTYTESGKNYLAYRIFDEGNLSECEIIKNDVVYLYPNLYDENLIGLARNNDYTELFKLSEGEYDVLISAKDDMEICDIVGESILVKANYIKNRGSGDLILYNGKKRLIDENIYKALHKTDKYIYAIKNFDTVLGGDLYLYNKGNAELIGTGVTDIIENRTYEITR